MATVGEQRIEMARRSVAAMHRDSRYSTDFIEKCEMTLRLCRNARSEEQREKLIDILERGIVRKREELEVKRIAAEIKHEMDSRSLQTFVSIGEIGI